MIWMLATASSLVFEPPVVPGQCIPFPVVNTAFLWYTPAHVASCFTDFYPLSTCRTQSKLLSDSHHFEAVHTAVAHLSDLLQ